MKLKPEILRLYAVTDRSWLKPGETLEDAVEQAINGGATMIQLREKNSSRKEKLELASELKSVCLRYRVPLIINDSVSLALECGADGVHLGQDDGDIKKAREILGEGKIIGATAHNVKEAVAACEAGADYLGCGAVFGSSTKDNTVPLSLNELKTICAAVNIPVAAIGGINDGNILKLKGTGISGAAVISAVFARNDIFSAAENLRKLITQVTGEN
ncbi:thiamine phosphate synthase [Porcipelethomonas sp.]|uniref:thiamine phosphate synthase n=1 Tax=Porcipelethomonas sp. TaxID=2981675 RepID=UPI003EF5A8B7